MVRRPSESDAESSTKNISTSSLKLWYEGLTTRYDTLNNATSAIDSKAGVVFAATVAILVFIAQSGLQYISILNILALIGVILVLFISALTINVKDFPSPISTSTERPEFYLLSDDDFTWRLIADIEGAIEKLNIINQKKAKTYRYTLIILGISALLFAASKVVGLTIVASWL